VVAVEAGERRAALVSAAHVETSAARIRPQGGVNVNAATCLFFVLVLAKLLVVGSSGFASPWLFLQDATVALVFGAVELALRGQRRWIWIPYGFAVAWIAINVPVGLVLGSWLTWPMLRAAGGPLADSIRYYLTLATLLPLAFVLAAGVGLPLLFRRKVAFLVASSCLALVAAATATPRSSNGFARTPLTAFAKTTSGVVFRKTTPDVVFSRFHGAAKGMNVVVVILESTAAQYLGLYGAGEDPMPTLTGLAGRSVVFDAAYAVYPESVKGLYATLCGTGPRIGEPLEASLGDPCSPLPEAFRAAGYRTGLFHAGRFGYLGMDKLVEQSGFDVAEDAGAIGGVVRSSFGVDEASTVARTLGWIQKSDDARPFFAMYMPAAGHHPYASAIPGPFKGETEFDRYRNALHETDLALAQLVSGLSSPEIINPTLLVVFADHGEAFGQHGGNRGHTLAIWDENVHVPMLVSIPGVTATPRRVTSPVSVLAVGATLLDLIGVGQAPGRRASSMLTDINPAVPFFADYSTDLFGVRDGCWKLQYAKDDERTQLFNLCDDPGETSDVAGRFQAIHDELVKRVEQFFAVRVRPRRVAA